MSYGGWACYGEASTIIYYVLILYAFMQSFAYMLEDVSWISRVDTNRHC